MQQRWKKIDYTTPSGAWGGPGSAAQFGWYAGTPYIDMSSTALQVVAQTVGAKIGDIWWLGGGPEASGGNAFMFIKAQEALTVGQLVGVAAPTTGTLTIPGVPVSTSAAITTNISNVAAGVNGEVGNWINVTPAAAFTTLQMRRIKANTAAATGNFTVAQKDFLRPNSPTDQDVFDNFSVFANADPVQIIRPYYGVVNTASTVPFGVALGTVTIGNYTIIQVAGLAAVSSVGNGTALAVNSPAVGGAAGVVLGQADFSGNAQAAPDKFMRGGSIIPLAANAAAGPILIPCYVNFLGV